MPAAILVMGGVVGLTWVNVDAHSYQELWEHHLPLEVGPFHAALDLREWVNDALMALFFLAAGVEIKRELVLGELRTIRAAALPAMGALGGMLAPIVIYLAITVGTSGTEGWAVPVATDAAFAVGVLALAGPLVPVHLKLFLLTLAIADDVGGIAIIAVAFTDDLSLLALGGAASMLVAAMGMRAARVSHPLAYVPVLVLMWFFTLRSGVHATIAGVVAGLLVPAAPLGRVNLIERLDRGLHPIVTFLVFPLFAVANTGVEVNGGVMSDAVGSRVFWGAALGLVVGKTLGITAFTLAAVRFGIGQLPSGVEARHIPPVALLGGIGFTVAIFIAGLSFGDEAVLGEAKLAILSASAVASLVGVLALRRTVRA
ncbi:MAG: Na+/H+ antiporter NhaA [Actinomycetia bacterium]|nr:Na+/H+ antiporter NhaA [Actinomycetes bacterium]